MSTICFGQSTILPLWEGEIPNSQKSEEKEEYPKRNVFFISKVQVPTLEVFLPAKQLATGQAVVICPGGGYHGVAYHWEGTDLAKWFNSFGVAAFVLKYRMPNSGSVKTSYEAPLQDAQRAIRMVRRNAESYKIDPTKIGIMGFSAGGHLASTLGTQFDKVNNFEESAIDTISARPDFMVLLYPVVTMKLDFTHKGSRNALLGDKPSLDLVEEFSNELQVKENTPPTFIVHASDDKAVPVENSLQFYNALREKKIPVELHLYPKGGHGFALAKGRGNANLEKWPLLLKDWLQILN
ncbi:alpha/beta hydrolase [Flavicella sediminum]|uniref:alpha/beta hydrolase n=1 Tax=Flavicella sediminum TaxID=2585141 RepID=UPI001FB8108B|nr:alpha/beta hydrolase [Flavicella sediminum]